MSSDDGGPSDFVSELYCLIVEEAWLWEVGGAITDISLDGEHVVHGPWDQAECSRHLLAWFDQGLIELYADPPEGTPRPRNRAEWQLWNNGYFLRVLERPKARDLLAHPERWTRGSDAGFIHLCSTDAGMAPDAPWW
jgi:hypothetical protein